MNHGLQPTAVDFRALTYDFTRIIVKEEKKKEIVTETLEIAKMYETRHEKKPQK